MRTETEEDGAQLHHLNALAASSEAADPVQYAESAERRSALLQALGTLTQKQREAVVLRYHVGCSDREPATILGCSSGTARHRVHAGSVALEGIIGVRYAWLLAETSSGDPARRDVHHV